MRQGNDGGVSKPSEAIDLIGSFNMAQVLEYKF